LSEDEFCIQFYTTANLAGEYFGYSFTRAGLVAEPGLSHAVRPCVEETTVPYALLRPFAAPGGILARVAAARSGIAAL
jgi:hypothetical protein